MILGWRLADGGSIESGLRLFDQRQNESAGAIDSIFVASR